MLRKSHFIRTIETKLPIGRSLLMLCIIINITRFSSVFANVDPHDEGKFSIAYDILPPSPDAASMGKYGNVNVGLCTGTPNPKIPLYTLKSRTLTVPISLSYSSNGIKVDELASWVGMGWSLNAGGVVIRTVKGKPDEFSTWLMVDDLHEYDADLHHFLQNATSESNDSEPDMYSFNFLGRGGRFVLDRETNKIVQIPYSDLLIEFNDVDGISTIVITDESGTKYTFGENGGDEYSKQLGATSTLPGVKLPLQTAWYLSKIEHLNGDYIDFFYKSNNYNYKSGISQTFKVGIGGGDCDGGSSHMLHMPEYIDVTTRHILGASLSSIETSTGLKANFTCATDRQDLFRGNRLTRISIRDENDAEFKRFDFSYQYSYNNGRLHSDISDDNTLKYRLFLNSVNIFGRNNIELGNPYQFSYYSMNSLPPRLSFSKDHWGYANGKKNADLVPKNPHYPQMAQLIGGDREPDEQYAINGLLEKITYPTKGYTQFKYSGNQYWDEITIYPEASLEMHLQAKTESDESNVKIVTKTAKTGVISHNQSAPFAFSIIKVPNCGYAGDPDKEVATLTILDQDGNPASYSNVINGRVQSSKSTASIHFTPNTANYQRIINLKAGKVYTVKLKVIWWCSDAVCTINYKKKLPPQQKKANVVTGGMRISKIFDYADGGYKIKEYNYNNYENRYKSSISDKRTSPVYTTLHQESDKCDFGSVELSDYILIHSNSQTGLYYNSLQNVQYPKVTVSYGKDFEGGGTEYYFNIQPHIDAYNAYGNKYILGAQKSEPSWYSGTLVQKNDFKIINGKQVNVKEESYNYSIDASRSNVIRGAQVVENYKTYLTGPYSFRLTAEHMNAYTLDCSLGHKHVWGRRLNNDLYCQTGSIQARSEGKSKDHYMVKNYLWRNSGYSIGDEIKGIARPDNISISEYRINTGHYQLDEVITIKDGVTSNTKYNYSSNMHIMPTETSITDSKGDVLRSKSKYAVDYTFANESVVYENYDNCRINCQVALAQCKSACGNLMNDCRESCFSNYNNSLNTCVNQRNNSLNSMYSDPAVCALAIAKNNHNYLLPVEKYTMHGNNTPKLISGDLIIYKEIDGEALPKELYSLQNDEILEAEFSESHIAGNNFVFQEHDYQKTLSYDSHDNYGNLLQQHKENDINSSYYWGYNSKYPIVVANNVAYDISGSTNDLKGAVAYALSFTSFINIDEYLSSIDNLTLDSQISSWQLFNNKLRQYFTTKNVPTTTYTYNPNVGITSQTDPNGKTTYYRYDSHDRLEKTINHLGNILKQYEYHYKEEPVEIIVVAEPEPEPEPEPNTNTTTNESSDTGPVDSSSNDDEEISERGYEDDETGKCIACPR